MTMTHAYLPAKRVSEACRLEHLDFEECLKDFHETERSYCEAC